MAQNYPLSEVWLAAEREGEEEVILKENINGCSNIYLEMNRRWDEKRIYFGNSSSEDGRVLLGKFIGIE